MTSIAPSEPIPLVSDGRALSARLHRPVGAPTGSIVVIHPHPGHGGHMDHSVVRTTAERATAAGLVALRIDVSGVRESEGDVGDWAAHLRDLDAASAAAAAYAPGAPRYGAGFSYGARLWMERMLRAPAPPVVGLLLLAPATRVPQSSRDFGDLLLGRPIRDAAIDPASLDRLARLAVPSRLVVGERDNVAPPDELRAHAGPAISIEVLDGVNHFFSRATGAGATAYDVLVPALDRALAALVTPRRT